MKIIAAFSALIASTLAQDYFTIMSTRSASPIHFGTLQANGGKFYIGGTPSSYCPPEVGDTCKDLPGNTTVLAGGQGTLSLGVVVPGGQQVYIAPDGTMSYTAPHSAYKPDGSIVDGWTKTEQDQWGTVFWGNGLVACPLEDGKLWQVYGQTDKLTLSPDCLGFNAHSLNTTKVTAWEY